MIVAKAIALAVLGLRDDDPRHVLSGAAFEAAGIFGAAESDFFDWVVAEPEGEALVRRILAHVRRFRLDQVESDVLKILYESLIDRDERHGLGEYYTPDWLAAKIVRHAVERPIEQRVLDPACGSGTFLFHAVRNFIKEAEEAGLDEKLRAAEATNHIAGMDIHPVAVIIARVTYLLALAPVIARRAGSLSIPVYLGDALQLSTATTMHLKELVIHVPPPPEGADLKFPEIFCKDIHLFDKLVARMRQGSEQGMTARQIEQAFKLEVERHYKRDMTKEEGEGVREMVATYATFDELRREGRDSVWTYVARNLSRPLALSFGAGWANVVVGNPPWVAFRHMSADLQKRFRELAKGERVYVGGKFATQNDLCRFVHGARGVALSSLGRTHCLRAAACGADARAVREIAQGLLLQRADRLGRSLDDGRRACSRCFRFRPAWCSAAAARPPRRCPTRCGPIPGSCRCATRRRRWPTQPDGARRTRRSRPKAGSRAARPTGNRFGRARRSCRACCVWWNARPWASGRRSDRAVCRQPPQQPGEEAVENAARRRAPGRSGVSASGAAGREHPALSRVAAVRGRRAGDGARAVLDAEAAAESRLRWIAWLDVGGGDNLERERRERIDDA